VHAVFDNNWLFAGLPRDVKVEILDRGAVREIAAGQTLIRAGAPNSRLFLVLEGRLRARLPDDGGTAETGVTLGHRGPGDLVGEYSMLDRLAPNADVIAEQDSLVFEIGHDAMRDVLGRDTDVGSAVYLNLLGYLVGRLRAQDRELETFSI
jgi:CRP-like cAMP-binding protein